MIFSRLACVVLVALMPFVAQSADSVFAVRLFLSSECVVSDDEGANADVASFNNVVSQKLTLKIDSSVVNSLKLTEFAFGESGDSLVWDTNPFFETSQNIAPLYVAFAKDANGKLYSTVVEVEKQPEESTSSYKWAVWVVLMALVLLASVAMVVIARRRLEHLRALLDQENADMKIELTKQKNRYEELLETKSADKEEKKDSKATRFRMVTVLFSNILGFSNVAGKENAGRMVDDLDRFVLHFDEVVKRLHIEKIKTVGDSYICAGGIPQKNHTNPIEVVLAAFEMYQYMQRIKLEYGDEAASSWDLRIGIHTGPVFCDNTGSKKKLEIWGDTVNIASRMEASGKVGKVNITGMTYELVRDYFVCQYWGKFPVKYRGEIDMYLIEGFKPHLSVDGLGLLPNKTFYTQLGLVRFDDLEEIVWNKLEDELPKNLYYHNLKHTIDVGTQVEIIGRSEGINDEELLLLKTAALFHDTGFTRTYKDHEEAGVEIAKEYLPKFDYTQEQIDTICRLIMKTKLPPTPETLLEKIICDSDLDYLGRADFIPVSGNLYKEMLERGMIVDDIDKWNEMQIKFISGHQYFTESAKRMRDVNKNKQLEAIRKLVEKKV